MAKFVVSGLLELQKEIAKISELDNGALAKEMLCEGSKDVANVWHEEAQRRHNKHTGNMNRSIDSSKPKKNKIGRYTVTYPMGTENRIRHGVEIKMRDAEKAFYQHYGYVNPWNGYFYSGDRWVEIVDMRSEPLVDKKMQSVFDKWLQKNQK